MQKQTYENTYIVPNFGTSQNESIGFPALNDVNEDKEISITQTGGFSKSKPKTERNIVPNVKILDLQHNMVQFNNFPQMLFEDNGRLIDSNSLKAELKALKIRDPNTKPNGRLVKPKTPLDMMSVEYNSKTFKLTNFNS